MESSRRAVEAYWRSRMIDGATADEDKVSPVYKLEEICELLRSSHVNIVKEVSDYILKRLDHKSPIVKQKALRLIKYSMGKSGVEFKREMQRNSGVIRQLFHYKGQLDPLKGNALNKAVCDTAHEAISAIFASDDKPVPTEDINRRIQGFGNTNFEMPTEDKKSFLREVVGLGSASIRQGLSSITAAHSLRKNDNGSYKSADLRPNLRRSLTTEIDSSDRFEREEHHRESFGSFGASKKDAGPWGLESRACTTETRNDDSVPNQTGRKSHEERLLETIVTSGGVRLQPTRDAIQAFLVEAAKLDALALSHALELKLQSPLWQVRMRAVCVLEAILRKKEASFATVASYFSESRDVIVNCSESPQASVREKANKVLGLLGGGQTIVGKTPAELSSVKSNTNAIVQLPDLIDTGDPDYFVSEGASQKNSDQSTTNLTASTLLVDDLFGDSLIVGVKSSGNKNIDDPFSDVSFHTTDALDRDHVDDLFSGLTVDEELNMPTIKSGSGLIDILSTNTEVQQEPIMHKNDLHELMAGLSVNETVPEHKQQGTFGGSFGANLVDSSGKKIHPMPNETLNGVMGGMNQNVLFPLGPLQYNFPANIMFNHAFASQPINYGVMGSLITQQQLLATMSNFQHLGNLANNVNVGFGNAGGGREEGYPLALPDTFHLLNNSIQSHSLMADSSKKGETRAFDFISDHLSAARDPKRDE